MLDPGDPLGFFVGLFYALLATAGMIGMIWLLAHWLLP